MLMKGISPLLATIFVIAFTVGVAGILSVWLTGFATTQTQTVGGSGEKLTKCGSTTLEIAKASFNCFTTGGNRYVNVTVNHKSGNELLYNLTLFVFSGGLQNKSYGTTVLNAGDSVVFTLINMNSTPTGASLVCPYESFRVTSLCQNSTVVSTDCNNGQNCFVRAE